MATIDVKDAAGSTITLERPPSPGRAAASSSKPSVLSNEDFAAVGATTETAPGTDTGTSGLNGRLQRVAQRLSSILALLPTALGGSGGLKVENVAALPAGTNSVGYVGGTDYETVAASQTDQVMGPTGASGDYLGGVLIIPTTTSPGVVSIKDGAGSAITVFPGGASSVSNLIPFYVPLGAKSGSGAWKITTGTNVSAIGVGKFT